MGGRYVLEVSNSKYPQKPAGLYHLLCDAYLDCGIDVLIFGIGLFIRCSCYGRKYVDADYWNFAYVSSGCFYVLVCDRLCDPLYAGTTEKGVCNLRIDWHGSKDSTEFVPC